MNIDAIPAVTVIKLLLLVGFQYSHNTISILLYLSPPTTDLRGERDRKRKTREMARIVFHLAWLVANLRLVAELKVGRRVGSS